MATMPVASPTGQPEAGLDWFASTAGQALLASESEAVIELMEQGRGLPWLWLAPCRTGGTASEGDAASRQPPARGLHLYRRANGWDGDARCGLELPLASESVDVVVLQHVLGRSRDAGGLLQECARVLVPGGRLGLFSLNPLAPYRWRWRGQGLRATEPLVWRRCLREAGLEPEPLSLGIGPSWRERPRNDLQQGAGVRAAYLLRAEKRVIPLVPVRRRRPAVMPGGVPAT